MLAGYFPLWTPTFDGRRITALSLLRSFPLVLMATPGAYTVGGTGAVGSYVASVGSINGLTITVEQHDVQVMCTCLLDDGIPADAYHNWFLVPDIDSAQVSNEGTIFAMTGNLIGATLIPRPSWPSQRPVTIHESPPL